MAAARASRPSRAGFRGGFRSGFRAGAYRFLVYALFIASTFTIAGSETSIILLMALALSDPLLWRWLRTGQPPAALPYGGQSPPAWTWAVFVALTASALISAVLNPGVLVALNDMRYHYRLFLPLVLVLALPHVSLPRLFGTFAVFVAVWALYGVIQYRYGVDWFRPEGRKLVTPYGDEGVFHAKGEFTHHITYGGVMLMATVFLLALASGRASAEGAAGPRLRALWGLGAAMGALATLLSLARSAWFGMMLGTLVLVVLRLPRRWAVSMALLGALAVAGYATLVLQQTWLRDHIELEDAPPLVQRLLSTSLKYDVDRLRLWQAGWLAVQDRPWFGAGMGHTGPVFEPYRDLISQRTGYWYQLGASAGVHNIYLQVGFDLGAVGLAAYLAVWAAAFAWSAQALRALGARGAGLLGAGLPGADGPDAGLPGAGLYRAVLEGCIAGLAGSMGAGLFENNAYDKEVQEVILMLMGLALFVGLRIRAARGRSGRSWGAHLYPNYAGARDRAPGE